MYAVLKTLGADRFRTTVAEGETPRTKPFADPCLAAARPLGVAVSSPSRRTRPSSPVPGVPCAVAWGGDRQAGAVSAGL
ncbi:hypothetical protein [Streptomyces caeruleatus]|uniref:hypothetical protein n=1 Tax=Streptomyces caeruleatus TaxID=661399 RepID=UPI000786BCE0|nr:hypothetical protein [Streptomyces caeruleatus]